MSEMVGDVLSEVTVSFTLGKVAGEVKIVRQ